jgi:NitT/TauT family transport system substrate-binding protein
VDTDLVSEAAAAQILKKRRLIMMKKLISGVTMVLTLALGLGLLAGCSQKADTTPPPAANTAEKPLDIRIGADSAAFSYQFRVALSAGIFAKHNINAEISTFSYGIDTINAAILGETDSAEGMDYAVASRFSESNNLRIVSLIGGPSKENEKLWVRDDAIQSPKDLVGKKLGVKKGTVNEYVWGKVFEINGIDPSQVEQIYLGSDAELLAAFQAGEVDAFWATVAIEDSVRAVSGSRILGDLDLAQFLYRGYLLLDAKFIEENKEGVVRFLTALDEATTYIKEHPEETAQIAYDDLKVPKEATLKSLESYNYTVSLSQDDLDHITNVANWAIENGLIKNKYDITQFLYLDGLREALPDKLTVK